VPDPLEDVLRFVVEGRLTAAEAQPIIEALERGEHSLGSSDAPATAGSRGVGSSDRAKPTNERRGGGRGVRLEVTEDGRTVVNLRVPVSLGEVALRNLPGISGAQVERIRQALADGIRGTILETVDDGDGVRIVID